MSHESEPDVAAQPDLERPGLARPDIERPRLAQPGSLSRRALLLAGGTGGALLASSGLADAADVPASARSRSRSAGGAGKTSADQRARPPGRPGRDYKPVNVPNGAKDVKSATVTFRDFGEQVTLTVPLTAERPTPDFGPRNAAIAKSDA
ncbi:MAG: hypothetical protein ABI560_13805, partial [Myxococcales bacterium]